MKSVDSKHLQWLCENQHLLNIIDLKTVDSSTGRKERIYYHQELKTYFKIIFEGYGSLETLIDIIPVENPTAEGILNH
jgi:hypothetical protein